MRSLSYMSAVMATAATTFLSNIILARLLSQSDYATFSLVTACISFGIAIALLGQPTAFTSSFFSTENEKSKSGVPEIFHSGKIIACGSILTVVICALAWTAKYKADISPFVLIGTLCFICIKAYSDFYLSVTNCIDDYRSYLIATTLIALLILTGIALKPFVETYLVMGCIAYGLSALFLSVKAKKRFHRANPCDRPNVTIVYMLKLGWVAVPGMLVTSGLALGERTIVANVMSKEDLAIYTLATTISVSGARVVVNALLKPRVISILQCIQSADQKAFQLIVKKAIHNLLAIFALFAIGVYAVGDFIINEVVGARYAPVKALLVPLFSAAIIEGIGIAVSQPLIQRGKLFLIVLMGIIGVGFNLILVYLLIPLLGLHALTFAFFCSSILVLAGTYLLVLNLGFLIPFPYHAVIAVIGINLLLYKITDLM